MALDAQQIHTGPANIYIGITAPATGTPPTWMTHTNGVPGSGTHIGYTTDDTVFTWQTTKNDIEAEQSLGVVDQFISAEMARLEFTALQRTYELMKVAFDNIGSVNDGTRMGFYGGGGGSVIEIQYVALTLTSRIRTLTNKYEVLTVYKAVSVEGIPITFSRTKPSQYKVTLRCLPDDTRDEGDKIFQFYREK